MPRALPRTPYLRHTPVPLAQVLMSQSGEWQGDGQPDLQRAWGVGACRPGRVPAGLPHGPLGSHRDTLSSSSLPPTTPGWADPTANYENENSGSRLQMSVFFWRLDSPLISAWSPKNLRNVALIMKIGTWPRGAHALIGTGASHVQPDGQGQLLKWGCFHTPCPGARPQQCLLGRQEPLRMFGFLSSKPNHPPCTHNLTSFA